MHSTGGYMVYTFVTTKYVFNMAPADIYWCAAGWGGEKRTSWGGKDDRQMRGALLHHRHKHTLNTCTHTHKNTHNTHAIRCTADCGWITGHSYLTYGPLLVGASQVVFEGVPTYPAADRCWQVVDKYQVRPPPPPLLPCVFFPALFPGPSAFKSRRGPSAQLARAVRGRQQILVATTRRQHTLNAHARAHTHTQVKQFYTAPTAIRSLMRAGELFVKEHNRDSLRILGSVGEPINPEAWRWWARRRRRRRRVCGRGGRGPPAS